MRKVVIGCGLVEAIAILIYGISILVKGTIDHSKVGSPFVQFVIYSMFSLAIFAIVNGLNRARNWARTPFYMIQIFTVIAGYTLVSGDGITVKVVGALVTILGATGFVALIRSPDSV